MLRSAALRASNHAPMLGGTHGPATGGAAAAAAAAAAASLQCRRPLATASCLNSLLLPAAARQHQKQQQSQHLQQWQQQQQQPKPLPLQYQQRRYEHAVGHAVSNPTLAGIEKRWEQMPPQDQAELWMQLRDRMKTDWHNLTWQEKKAAYWIAFGPHGPRAPDSPPGEKKRLFYWTMFAVGVAAVMFIFARSHAKPPPSTMTREWQEMTNEYLREQRVEPITGVSSDGYTGKGHVQSRPAKK